MDTFGTGVISDVRIPNMVINIFDLRPKAIIPDSRPFAANLCCHLAAYGHFGRTEPNFTWERTDKAEVLRDAAGIKAKSAAHA